MTQTKNSEYTSNLFFFGEYGFCLVRFVFVLDRMSDVEKVFQSTQPEEGKKVVSFLFIKLSFMLLHHKHNFLHS